MAAAVVVVVVVVAVVVVVVVVGPAEGVAAARVVDYRHKQRPPDPSQHTGQRPTSIAKRISWCDSPL